MELLSINFIDGQDHDLVEDYDLLLAEKAFEVEFSPSDIDDVLKLGEEINDVISKIDTIKDERDRINVFGMFLKAMSNQLGVTFSSANEMKEYIRTLGDQAGFIKNQPNKQDTDLSDLKTFDSGSELVEMENQNG